MNKDKYFMSKAYLNALQSEDPSTKVGCVIVGPDNEIRSEGYNGLPRGFKHLEERLQRPLKYKYMCHAERNAIFNAARIGVSVKGCIIYINAFPCCDCARAIIQSGIKEVVIHKQMHDITKDRWQEEIELVEKMFQECGVKYRFYNDELFTEIKGYFDNIEIELA